MNRAAIGILHGICHGEVLQLNAGDKDPKKRWDTYFEKTYYKTAALYANSCLSLAALACEQVRMYTH